jgi:hypothetical protein
MAYTMIKMTIVVAMAVVVSRKVSGADRYLLLVLMKMVVLAACYSITFCVAELKYKKWDVSANTESSALPVLQTKIVCCVERRRKLIWITAH